MIDLAALSPHADCDCWNDGAAVISSVGLGASDTAVGAELEGVGEGSAGGGAGDAEGLLGLGGSGLGGFSVAFSRSAMVCPLADPHPPAAGAGGGGVPTAGPRSAAVVDAVSCGAASVLVLLVVCPLVAGPSPNLGRGAPEPRPAAEEEGPRPAPLPPASLSLSEPLPLPPRPPTKEPPRPPRPPGASDRRSSLAAGFLCLLATVSKGFDKSCSVALFGSPPHTASMALQSSMLAPVASIMAFSTFSAAWLLSAILVVGCPDQQKPRTTNNTL
mmetsp:Transcript_14392/g.35695  ORF Transcript_14392/g.35695 Transcript_14392/m.35695 type:complete len:273 (-) Transcript_14392:58-876(-)